MSAADDQLREANWDRMRQAISRAAREYRRTANDLERIQFDDSNGRRRSPDAIISQAALTIHTSAGADLIHRLATWAESINEIERHDAANPGPACNAHDDLAGVDCGLPLDHDGDIHRSTDGVRWRVGDTGAEYVA